MYCRYSQNLFFILYENNVKNSLKIFFLLWKSAFYVAALQKLKLARGDRPHIFTGVKPLKPFIYCSIEETSFRGSYSLKFER